MIYDDEEVKLLPTPMAQDSHGHHWMHGKDNLTLAGVARMLGEMQQDGPVEEVRPVGR